MNDSETNYEHLVIKDWSVNDRPREKYITKGPAALSNAELIAILLRTGNHHETAVDLAKRLLHSCNNRLICLSDFSLHQLMKIHGIGQAKATTLQAAFELGNRIRSEKIEIGQYIHSSKDVVEIMQDKTANLKHEEFWVIFLNQKAKILKISPIGKGGITSTPVDVRLILKVALLYEATSIIACHNHPSGSIKPSENDIMLTRQIQKAVNYLNIRLLDHIIIHRSSYYSFQEEGIL